MPSTVSLASCSQTIFFHFLCGGKTNEKRDKHQGDVTSHSSILPPTTKVKANLYPTEAIHQRNKVCCIAVITV